VPVPALVSLSVPQHPSAHHELSRRGWRSTDNCTVHLAGSKSWRFEHDDLDVLRRALFVRDAAMLPVAVSEMTPPRLTGDVPASSERRARGRPGGRCRAVAAVWGLMLDQAVREFGSRNADDPGDDRMASLTSPAQVAESVRSRWRSIRWRQATCCGGCSCPPSLVQPDRAVQSKTPDRCFSGLEELTSQSTVAMYR
jgi:hypothetical protein